MCGIFIDVYAWHHPKKNRQKNYSRVNHCSVRIVESKKAKSTAIKFNKAIAMMRGKSQASEYIDFNEKS